MLYAELDNKNLVKSVIVADDLFVQKLPGKWVKACPQGLKPKNYPSIGYTWVPALNCFLPPRPSLSYDLDAKTLKWKSCKRHSIPNGPAVPGEYTLELRDANGKRIYEIIEEGPHKTERKKIPVVVRGLLLDSRSA